jgi:hypothetical protein
LRAAPTTSFVREKGHEERGIGRSAAVGRGSKFGRAQGITLLAAAVLLYVVVVAVCGGREREREREKERERWPRGKCRRCCFSL